MVEGAATFTLTVERGKVREFARSLGFTDPVYFDEDAARAAGFGDLPAPPTFLISSVFWNDGHQARKALGVELDYRFVLHGEQEYELMAPIVAGDILTGTQSCVRDETKEGKRGGKMRLVTFETRYANQHDREVAVSRSTMIETGGPVKSVR